MDVYYIEMSKENQFEENFDMEILQKPNIYNKYLPFYPLIQRQSRSIFEEICENLSRCIQLRELRPGFPAWSWRLERFLSLYGFDFTKDDHLKLIRLYLSILSIPNLTFTNANICFNILDRLLGKTRLIQRDDLVIDWRIFYDWFKIAIFNHDAEYGLVVLPKDLGQTLMRCVQSCRFYFSVDATMEILDEFRPWLCPFDSIFSTAMYYFAAFLPINLPENSHEKNYRLWLEEFFSLWLHLCGDVQAMQNMTNLFSHLAWYNIGYIDWEPWLSEIFTRVLGSFSLPIGNMPIALPVSTHTISNFATWIVAMIGNGCSVLRYLSEFLIATKNYYHPSNTGDFQQNLLSFLSKLGQIFVNRLRLERKSDQLWFFNPRQSYRLTDNDITSFVLCLKDYVLLSIFNKTYLNQAVQACQYLSQLRPELIIPELADLFFSSVDRMIEPHRFTSIVSCLTAMARQIVRRTPKFPQGQSYVVPMLLAVLPGIDSNDMEKTKVTYEFINAILMLISCVDCSSAVHTRDDLSEIEKDVCLSTEKFDDFISEFLNRTFQMIEVLASEMSDAELFSIENDTELQETGLELTSTFTAIVQQCSESIFHIIREKITNFVAKSSYSPKTSQLVNGLVRAILKGNPTETLKSLLPTTCERIEKILSQSDASIFDDHHGDWELRWALVLFSELVRARGDTLLPYKSIIESVFIRCHRLIHKESHEALAAAARNLLKSLLSIYPIESQLIYDPTFQDSLPIRTWGEHVEFDQLNIQFHIPNGEEIDFACQLIEKILYDELNLLNESCSKMSNEERLRSLTMIRCIATGSFRIIPRVSAEPVKDIITSVVPLQSQYYIPFTMFEKEPIFKENLRLQLMTEMEKVLDILVKEHPDDTASIQMALKTYSLTSIYFGVFEHHVDKLHHDIESTKNRFKNPLLGQRKYPRFFFIKRIVSQIESFSIANHQIMTEFDRRILMKLFDLSIDRYSEVREGAQNFLLYTLHRFLFSFEILIDPIDRLLNSSTPVDHHQIKGCLYILLGDPLVFIPAKHTWRLMERLWPDIIQIHQNCRKSTQNLITSITSKIVQKFDTPALTEDTNDRSIQAAKDLWRPLNSDELEGRDQRREGRNQNNIQSYQNLLKTLSTFVIGKTCTWRQQEMATVLMQLILQRDYPIPAWCIGIIVDLLVHENHLLRKFSEQLIASLCRLQKPLRIYQEKTLEEILHRSVDISRDQPGDRDDNLWVTIDQYQPPTTEDEWQEMCFLDKAYHGYYQWPKQIRYVMNKRDRFTEENMSEEILMIYRRFLDKEFLRRSIQWMVDGERTEHHAFDLHRFRLFKGLFRNFGSIFLDDILHQCYRLIRDKSKTQEASHAVASHIVAGLIRGSKHWTLAMLDELWLKLMPFFDEVCLNLSPENGIHWDSCFTFAIVQTDPRRMIPLIDYLRSLISPPAVSNPFLEITAWSLLQKLSAFQWRIPSVWHDISSHANELLDHPSKIIRERIVSVVVTSLAYDIQFPIDQSKRHPKIDNFFDSIIKRFNQAVDIYENTHSEKNIEGRRALNFIDGIIQLFGQIFAMHIQPIKRVAIEILPQLCQLESLLSNNDSIRRKLLMSRIAFAMNYVHVSLLKELIDQLTLVCNSTKWHGRRAAMEFIQILIFSNLFNARPYAKQIKQIVFRCLFDEQFEVRSLASVALAGFYQCGFIPLIKEDLEYFRLMSKTRFLKKIDGKKISSSEKLIQRHGGVLGLSSIVLSNPYEIGVYLPEALMFLCEHSDDPDLIQKSVKKTLSEFRRTHQDSWHEHRERFTEDQLVTLADVLISPSYYA